jgi:hypothetical protein
MRDRLFERFDGDTARVQATIEEERNRRKSQAEERAVQDSRRKTGTHRVYAARRTG